MNHEHGGENRTTMNGGLPSPRNRCLSAIALNPQQPEELCAGTYGGECIKLRMAQTIQAGSLAEMLTFDFVVPANAQDLRWDVEVYANEAGDLLRTTSLFSLSFEPIDMPDHNSVAQTSSAMPLTFQKAKPIASQNNSKALIEK